MKRIAVLAVLLVVAAALCFGQDAAPTQSPATPQTTSSAPASNNMIKGSFPTSLFKSLDSKKLKVGDPVICETVSAIHTSSGFFIPSGSKIMGHVTQATARSKGDSDATLAMTFDKIELGKGKQIEMKGTLVAVAPSLGSSGPDTGAASGGSMGSSGSRGGSSSVGTTPPPSPSAVAGPNAGIHPLEGTVTHPVLNGQSVGVLGFHNLTMDKDGVLSSTGKEVKLESNTQMLLRVEIQPPVE